MHVFFTGKSDVAVFILFLITWQILIPDKKIILFSFCIEVKGSLSVRQLSLGVYHGQVSIITQAPS